MVKTHKFMGRKYKLFEGHGYDGFCDVPTTERECLEIHTLAGRDYKALSNQIHEFSHALGMSDKFLHRDDRPCDALAKALIRMGWTRCADNIAPMD